MRLLIPVALCCAALNAGTTKPYKDVADATRDILRFHITQKTCALYVAPHSGALGPVAFGRDIDEGMVRWNFCPGGTMVACSKVPSAAGDTILTGIPWSR